MNPADEDSHRALDQVHRCLERGESFLVEAGARAGHASPQPSTIAIEIPCREPRLRRLVLLWPHTRLAARRLAGVFNSH